MSSSDEYIFAKLASSRPYPCRIPVSSRSYPYVRSRVRGSSSRSCSAVVALGVMVIPGKGVAIVVSAVVARGVMLDCLVGWSGSSFGHSNSVSIAA